MYTVLTYTPQETFDLAACLGRHLKGGELIALEGELGAGKTHFVKGLAAGLDASEPVTSPTFTLIHLYEGRLTLAHFDVYRLPNPEALEELGYEEFFYGPGVTAVEWSDLITSYLPPEYLQVKISRQFEPERGESRLISLIPHGETIKTLLQETMNNVSSGN